jgi:hypothetical protein
MAPRSNRRQSRKAAQWKRHLETWQGSGLSQAEFCRQFRLSVKSFGYWKRRFAQEAASVDASPTIVALPLERLMTSEAPSDPQASPSAQPRALGPHDHRSSLVLATRNGFRIEIPDDFYPPLLAKLVVTLERL